jgi:hypothetical protein
MMLFWGLTGKACRCLDAVPTPGGPGTGRKGSPID